MIVSIVLALVVMVVTPLAVLLSGRSSGSEGASSDQQDGPRATATTDTSPESTVASSTSTTVIPLLQVVESLDGRFRVGIPTSLDYLMLDGDVAGIGVRMYPNDANMASRMEQIAGTVLNGSLTKLVAINSLELGSGQGFPADLIEVQGHGGFVGYDPESVIADYERELTSREGLTVNESGRLATAIGDIAWYDVVPGGDQPEVFARHYVLAAGDWAWVLIFWVTDLAGSRATTDAIAATFEPL